MGKLTLTLRIFGIALFGAVALFVMVFSLPFTGWRALSVQTGSMEPALPTGSLVIVNSIPAAQLAPGDVITYKSKELAGQTITHRLVERRGQPDGPQQYIAKGDANQNIDNPVYENQIVGKVVYSAPIVGRVLDALKTPWGLALTVYLPAMLIFISEIRLLVRRLTQIEISRQKAQLATESGGMPTPPADIAPFRINKPKRGKFMAIAAALAVPLLVGSTFAQITSTASLTGNTISGVSPISNHVLILRVDLPGALGDPISFQPLTLLYNPVPGQTFDMQDWRLESSSGLVFGFNGPTPIYPRQRLDVHSGPSGILLSAGDYMVLKDAQGNVVDAISWGSNTSQMDPSIQGVAVRKMMRRITNNIDTNTSADFEVRNCCN